MTFGDALDAVKSGKKASRSGWNGNGQYIALATCVSYKNTLGDIVNVDHSALGTSAIVLVGPFGVQLGWMSSQADMLADDWEIRD